MFQNGDWLMTSFKATNTQNVPFFFMPSIMKTQYLFNLYSSWIKESSTENTNLSTPEGCWWLNELESLRARRILR